MGALPLPLGYFDWTQLHVSGVSGSRSVSGSVLLSSASVKLFAVVSLLRGLCPLLVARLPPSSTLATPL